MYIPTPKWIRICTHRSTIFSLPLPHDLTQPLFFIPLLLLLLLSRFSRVRLCVTPQTAAHRAPPSLGFSRQEHWSGLPFPSPVHESEKWKWSLSSLSLFSTSMLVHRVVFWYIFYVYLVLYNWLAFLDISFLESGILFFLVYLPYRPYHTEKHVVISS